ncbi:MAG: tetratricopeptide repeat protein [Acidobacteriia bacterium]|nr:tetratricopeptide repeat protein [Terriglobia bacterium]
MRIASRHFRVVFCLAAALFTARQARASELNIPPEATIAIHLMYSGQPDRAVALARQLETSRPEHPLGYLIEADILWWKIYCKWSERKYNTIDAWSHTRPADSDDDADLALADKVTRLAEASIAKSDTAEMELYAGLGYASRARLLGLRYEKMPVARAGVEARKHLLRCLELDPNMADANLGLGLYNYYVDTLSALAKILRFFMGIPGGDKGVGLRQLETASSKGDLTQMEARFNMAKSLRNYDRDYARAAKAAAPLLAAYPVNPIFLLLAGDIEQKLGHNDAAAAKFRAAAASPEGDPACAAQVQKLAREALASMSKPD